MRHAMRRVVSGDTVYFAIDLSQQDNPEGADSAGPAIPPREHQSILQPNLKFLFGHLNFPRFKRFLYLPSLRPTAPAPCPSAREGEALACGVGITLPATSLGHAPSSGSAALTKPPRPRAPVREILATHYQQHATAASPPPILKDGMITLTNFSETN